MVSRPARGLAAVAVALLMAGPGFSRTKLSPQLNSISSGETVNVIVQFAHPLMGQHHQKIRSHGGTLKSEIGLIQGALYAVPASALEPLSNDPEVVYISPDHTVRGSLDYTGPAVNADVGQRYGYDGRGVGVAIIDSGIAEAPDLSDDGGSRIVYSQSFVNDENAGDQYGHGTHVAGIVAGNGSRSTGSRYSRTFLGIAPAAHIVNFRVLDASGQGFDSGVIRAIQRAIELKDVYNIRVINLSLGRPVYESYTQDPLCQAAAAAWRAGIVVVAAAGNAGRDNPQGTDGYATIAAPGNDPLVITAGAMKTMETRTRGDDLIASYSSKGPTFIDHVVKPDLVAPGNRVISLQAPGGTLEQEATLSNGVAYQYYADTSSPDYSPVYFRLSGTSMAAAVVSGAAALLIQKDSTLTPDQVKARLMKTASKAFPSYSSATDPVTGMIYTSQYDLFTVGAGYLDIWAALANTDVSHGPALSPRVIYNPRTGNVLVARTPGSVWDNDDLWDSTAIWGPSLFVDGTAAVWGTTAVWGSSTTEGFAAVWGTTAVWGNSLQDTGESTRLVMQGEN